MGGKVGILNPTGGQVDFKTLDLSEIWQYSSNVTTPKSVAVY